MTQSNLNYQPHIIRRLPFENEDGSINWEYVDILWEEDEDKDEYNWEAINELRADHNMDQKSRDFFVKSLIKWP
jgi:hypothetical protein